MKEAISEVHDKENEAKNNENTTPPSNLDFADNYVRARAYHHTDTHAQSSETQSHK